MKAITLSQPWASLVACGAKCIDTRWYSTTYRGPLAIHVARTFPLWSQRLCGLPPYVGLLADAIDRPTADWRVIARALPVGKVIAVVELYQVDVVTDASATALSHQERRFGNYTSGRFAWHLRNAERLRDPFVARGAIGLWEVEFPTAPSLQETA